MRACARLIGLLTDPDEAVYLQGVELARSMGMTDAEIDAVVVREWPVRRALMVADMVVDAAKATVDALAGHGPVAGLALARSAQDCALRRVGALQQQSARRLVPHTVTFWVDTSTMMAQLKQIEVAMPGQTALVKLPKPSRAPFTNSAFPGDVPDGER